MLPNKAFIVSVFATLAIGQTSIDTSSASSTKHAKHSAIRSVTSFPSVSKNDTAKASSSSIHVTTVTETVALSLVLDILDISVRVASDESSAHKGESSKARHSSRQPSPSSSSHGCSITTTPQQTCGGPGTTTVISTVSQGFTLGTASTTRSSTSSTPPILSATSSSG